MSSYHVLIWATETSYMESIPSSQWRCLVRDLVYILHDAQIVDSVQRYTDTILAGAEVPYLLFAQSHRTTPMPTLEPM